MKNLIAVGLMAALAACGGGSNPTTDVTVGPDAKKPGDGGGSGSADAPIAACQVLTQTGCNTGEKCTWVLSTDDGSDGTPGLGAISCAPNGTVAAGAACTIAKVAAGGYDNCVAGTACVSGTCKNICDNNGGAPMCGTNQACVIYDGLFANSGATVIPAGVCDPSCNPLADNDFDGSGSAYTKTGTACGTSNTTGCYGFFSDTHTTYYTCAPPAGSTGNLTHRSVVPDNLQYLNSCMSGYHLGEFYADDSGTMQIVCFAYCAPGEAYMGNTGTQAPNGVAPHRCSNQDALGNFGATPNNTGTTNGEHCWYSWYFEIDTTNVWHKSPTSDTVGTCLDHTKYKYDPTGGMNPTLPFPACASLPKNGSTSGTTHTYGADDFACVNSTDAMLTSTFNGKSHVEDIVKARVRNGIMVPEFPAMKASQH